MEINKHTKVTMTMLAVAGRQADNAEREWAHCPVGSDGRGWLARAADDAAWRFEQLSDLWELQNSAS